LSILITGMMYFKHAVVYDIDETIGDIHARVLDRQKDLLLEVECAVLECEYHFLQLAVILESLDAIISLGTISKERNYVRPEIVEDPVVIVKSGRHPLQELTVDDFIPNDIFMSPDKHIGVITGLNGSGKSIYLKQVGLLVYLAHVGSFLPCERAVIGLCDRILTRVSSVETAVCPLSAFMLDLSQLKRMLDLFTARSLCLIDEFGKGTAPVDGMALLAATIMRFHRTPPCRVMFTTHFLEIFHTDIIDISCLSSVTTFKMDTYVDSLSPNDGAVATKAAAVSMQHVAAVGEISPRVAAATNMEVASAAAGMRVDVTPLEEVPLYKLKVIFYSDVHNSQL
jgi:DNA mismatch repair protein MSH5